MRRQKRTRIEVSQSPLSQKTTKLYRFYFPVLFWGIEANSLFLILRRNKVASTAAVTGIDPVDFSTRMGDGQTEFEGGQLTNFRSLFSQQLQYSLCVCANSPDKKCNDVSSSSEIVVPNGTFQLNAFVFFVFYDSLILKLENYFEFYYKRNQRSVNSFISFLERKKNSKI